MHALIAVQVAFCFVVHFVAGLFVTTFDRLSNQPTGFSAERILNLETVTQRPQPPVFWDQVAEHLRTVPGVEKVALIGWPLMSGESAVGNISINGAPPDRVFSDFLSISPGWTDTMRIPLHRRPGLSPERHEPHCRDRQPGFREAILRRGKSGRKIVRESGTGGPACSPGDRGPGPRCPLQRQHACAHPADGLHSVSNRWTPRACCGRSAGAHSSFALRARTRSPSASILRQEVPRRARIPRQQHPHADGNQPVAHRSRAAAGHAGAVLRGGRALARGRRPYMACSTTPCCNGGAKSAFAWRSARRPAASRDS